MTDDTIPMPYIFDDEPPWLVNREDVQIQFPSKPSESPYHPAIGRRVSSGLAWLLGRRKA